MRTIRVMLITLLCQPVLTAKLEESVAINSKGSNIRLTCYRENLQDKLLWTTAKGTILFNDDVRYTKAEQYSNFEVEILEDRSTLIIVSADLDDEGEYFCSDSMGKEMVNVSIEVSPNLEMKVNGIVEPSLMPNISITCRATGAKPDVSIRLRAGEGGWLMPTVSETNPSGLLWDTIATFNILLPTDTTGTSVTCRTFGQISVEHITVTEYLSSPTCILQYNKLEISCNCTSNPPVDKYLFAIEGETNVTGSTAGTLSVANVMGSEVICYGLSTLGIGKSNAIVVPPKEESESSSAFFIVAIVAIIVAIIVALVASFIICWVYTRRKTINKGDVKSTNDNQNNTPDKGNVGSSNDDQENTSGANVNTPLISTETGTSDKGNDGASTDDKENTLDKGNVGSSNDDQENTSGDDVETKLQATQTGKGNSESSNCTQENTAGDDVKTTPLATQTVSEVPDESTANTSSSIHRYEGTQGNDAKSATEDFAMSGGVKQMTADYTAGPANLKPRPTE